MTNGVHFVSVLVYFSMAFTHTHTAKASIDVNRYRSDMKVSDRYLIDVDPSIFAIWVFNYKISTAIFKQDLLQREKSSFCPEIYETLK